MLQGWVLVTHKELSPVSAFSLSPTKRIVLVLWPKLYCFVLSQLSLMLYSAAAGRGCQQSTVHYLLEQQTEVSNWQVNIVQHLAAEEPESFLSS